MASTELMLYRHNLQSRCERLGQLPADALRRRGVEVARDCDLEGLWELTEAYLVLRGARGARVSHHTLATYRYGLETFLRYAGQAGGSLLQPRPNDGFSYVRWLETQGLAPASVKSRLATARCLYAALRWSGASDAAPFSDVRAPADPVPRTEKRRPYSALEVQSLLAIADAEETVIVLLGAHAGLRVSEMLSLTRPDLHLDVKEPYLTVTGKRQKRQDVPVSPTLSTALRRWTAMTPQLAPRLLSVTTRETVRVHLAALCERAGVRYDKRAVHGLRHSAGTRVYSETHDLLEVRDHLRHRDITSSEIYVEYARKDKPAVTRKW